ncbi:MAG TPA: cytochrome b/b6 domain-containing protein [Acetobacteraceae bacterium]|jgi:cytochrome b561|nr:cytochrome b/b6 domain-containing protein [Acetobacteraceae bacterium]
MRTGNDGSPAEAPGEQYDRGTIALHWATAVLVGLLWVIGQTIDFAPSGPLRVDYRSLHMTLGVTLLGVFVLRAIWRLTRGSRLPGVGSAWMQVAARMTHGALYGLVLVTLGLGLANVWARGDVIYNLFTVPAFDPSNKPLRQLIGGWHALAANGTLILAGLHAAAALIHHYVLRDGVLRRMLPMV